MAMRPLHTLEYWQINTKALMAADFSAGHVIAADNADFEMVSGCAWGELISLKVVNSYHGTFNAIGVDDYGVGSEHIVFEREDGARVLFFYNLEV